MNNRERELWVLNDEGIYNWFKSSRLCMTKFIKVNRDELDRIIKVALK